MIQSAQPNVVVIGGGPAGATAATLIAQHGFRVELFEREKFPRFHIGESLIPATYWVLERLKMIDKLKSSPFVEKYSVQFVNDNGKVSAPFYFMEHRNHESSQTWQVVRSEFDQMMLQNASEQGVTVHEETRVLDVLFDGERAVGVQIQGNDGVPRQVFADVIVDASGQSSLLINKLKLKQSDPMLNKGSIWTYFRGAFRDEGTNAGATVILQTPDKKGWFWYIPLQNDIVSVGVVAEFEYLFKNGNDHETTYWNEVERCTALKERIASAEQVSKIYATKDFTYRAKQAAGDGWVLIGDAFGFLDPLYSSGILLALKSGQLAADAIVEGLRSGDTSRAVIGAWEPDFVVGMNRMRRLVCEYYDNFNFGRFIRSYPHHRGDLTDLLIGEVFKEELDQVFDSIDAWKAEDQQQPAMS